MTTRITSRIAGRSFELDSSSIERALEDTLPAPIKDHFVVVAGRRFPVKQVVSAVTGLDRADFTTHQARSLLRRLGFTVARRSETVPAPVSEPDSALLPHGGRQAEALRPHAGKWVAAQGLEVLVSSNSFDDVVAWLERFDRVADIVFRVPATADEADFPLSG